MSRTFKRAWNIISGTLVALVVVLALLLVGARFVGLRVFTVLSGSMEPSYHTGSLIYVKEAEASEITVGDAITYMVSETIVATHRVVGIVPDADNPAQPSFRTKGDANDHEDAGLVHCKNVIGTPVFTIPGLGYVADFVQHAPGKYISLCAVAVLLLLVFLPELLAGGDAEKRERPVRKQ